MELSKKNILSLIEKIDINNLKVLNVNIFGNEVLFDVETNNPTLQSKKNIENKKQYRINYFFINTHVLNLHFSIV